MSITEATNYNTNIFLSFFRMARFYTKHINKRLFYKYDCKSVLEMLIKTNKDYLNEYFIAEYINLFKKRMWI